MKAVHMPEGLAGNINEARKFWCLGDDTNSPNLLIDCNQGIQYLNDSFQRGFKEVCYVFL